MNNIAKVTDSAILINIPFAIPAIGLSEPTTITIDKATLQLVVRIIVAIASIFLFWPKVKMAFGFGVGGHSEAEQKEIQERIAKLEYERDLATGQKSYAVATGASQPATPAAANTPKEKGSAKRRKA